MQLPSLSRQSIRLQTTSFYFALVKTANTVGYLSLIYFTWLLASHQLDWRLPTGCVILSGGWLVLTRIKVDHLLQTYFDIVSRIELQLPVCVGLAMSMVALCAPAFNLYLRILALVEVFGWVWIWSLYRANLRLFKRQGYGPVPVNTWINPPASVFRPGDLVLTSGNIARNIHESVSHAEVVLRFPDGEMKLFSSYMGRGIILRSLAGLHTKPDRGYSFYWVGLRLKKPLSDTQQVKAVEIVEEMMSANKAYIKRRNSQVDRAIRALPLPKKLKLRLRRKLKVDGYDWFGMFMGRLAPDRWTCIGAALELYNRLGVKTNRYGTGLLGFGTTLFDPILPVRFLADPAFQLITNDEKDESLKT